MRTRSFVITGCVTIGLLWPLCHAFSATPEEDALKQRVAALERIVKDLKSRLSKLEAPSPGRAPATTSSNYGEAWKDKANWRSKLTKGLSKTDVVQMFGEPSRVSTVNTMTTYFDGYGFIMLDDSRGVISWNEPP